MKARFIACLVFAIAALAVASCGDSDPESTTVTVTEATGGGNQSDPVQEPDDQTTGSKGGRGGSDETIFFQSPTGNIGCALSANEVRCDIAEREWEPGPRPEDCPPDTDYGQGLTLDSSGTARFVCAGDTVLGQGEELPYGESVSAGRLTCVSEQSGITCGVEDVGFELSRQSYEFIGTIQAG